MGHGDGGEGGPKYFSILQYVTSNVGPGSNACHPETPKDYFKPMYFQALDAIVKAINDRFEQPG